MPEPTAAMNAHAVSLIAEGDAARLSDEVPAILKRPARTLGQFASDHARRSPERRWGNPIDLKSHKANQGPLDGYCTYELGGPAFDVPEIAWVIREVTDTPVTSRDLAVEEFPSWLQEAGRDEVSAPPTSWPPSTPR